MYSTFMYITTYNSALVLKSSHAPHWSYIKINRQDNNTNFITFFLFFFLKIPPPWIPIREGKGMREHADPETTALPSVKEVT